MDKKDERGDTEDDALHPKDPCPTGQTSAVVAVVACAWSVTTLSAAKKLGSDDRKKQKEDLMGRATTRPT